MISLLVTAAALIKYWPISLGRMQKMINKIIETINEEQSFLITSHVKLDGDALGSELALFLMLDDLGKKVVVYNQDETPTHYSFLPAAQEIVHEPGDVSRYDAAFVLDCSE